MATFVRTSRLGHSADEVFRWHARPGAFERLTPPWERVERVAGGGSLEPGSRLVLRTRVGPIARLWVAEHTDLEPGRRFRDVQVRGPFARWEHTHSMRPVGSGCELEDRVEYDLPLGALGRLAGGRLAERRVRRLFDYRHRVTERDLARHARHGGNEMKVLVTGSSGLVGKALCAFLGTGGHQVVRLVRRDPRDPSEARWDTRTGEIDARALEDADAVVHLAGESIAEGRWNAEKKRRIRDSRVLGTRALATSLAARTTCPATFVCASAIGFYGDRGDEVLTEASGSGTGFLPDTCREWEAACEPLREARVRVVNTRIGVVLSAAGGALAKMLLPFKLGAGGRIGTGEQWMSWIALDDLVGVLHHALVTDDLAGPVNAVAPYAVTNREFTKTLGRVLGRPTVLPMPATAARLALGEMADELLLASARVEPRALARSGFAFDYPLLEGALRHVLGRPAAPATAR